ncbi:MAPK regulated corepressor interacting protein 2 [Cydia amplana]|uniref:MAPK regulated corepressor interacting protein 2 n=1 Tax=Cydia amplana TaxID=1869771 RepID=UPI002FE5ED14
MDRNNMRAPYVSSGPRSLPHLGKRHSNGHSHAHSARLSPPAPSHNNNTQQDDIINYIYDSWNKVTREVERGGEEARYYSEAPPPRQLANFRPFNLDEWWGRRLLQAINRSKHRS